MGDVELDIMACLVLEPSLMEKIRVTDEHFTKHKRLWIFMKTFYDKFKTFDISLMYSACKDKYQMVSCIEMLLDRTPTKNNFEKYQDLLIEQHTENRYEKWLILKICELSDNLYLKRINTSEYASKLRNLYIQKSELEEKEKKDGRNT